MGSSLAAPETTDTISTTAIEISAFRTRTGKAPPTFRHHVIAALPGKCLSPVLQALLESIPSPSIRDRRPEPEISERYRNSRPARCRDSAQHVTATSAQSL